MCFFGFMRAGELVVPSDCGFNPSCHLAAGDVLVDSRTSPRYLVVNVKASKMDPFRQGVQIHLGRTHSELCPVTAILTYMVRRELVMVLSLDLRMANTLPEIDL